MRHFETNFQITLYIDGQKNWLAILALVLVMLACTPIGEE